jgi:glucose/arabinose dehydrogenase
MKQIKNFGWPISSYGEHYYKNYSEEILEQAPLNNSHKNYGFEEPIKYFVPSIGISEIVPLDKNDSEFFIGAMGSEVIEKDLGLHYILLDKNKNEVINHKYVLLNERVRDMTVSNDRKTIILFLETSGSLAIIKKN